MVKQFTSKEVEEIVLCQAGFPSQQIGGYLYLEGAANAGFHRTKAADKLGQALHEAYRLGYTIEPNEGLIEFVRQVAYFGPDRYDSMRKTYEVAAYVVEAHCLRRNEDELSQLLDTLQNKYPINQTLLNQGYENSPYAQHLSKEDNMHQEQEVGDAKNFWKTIRGFVGL